MVVVMVVMVAAALLVPVDLYPHMGTGNPLARDSFRRQGHTGKQAIHNIDRKSVV